ncbi:MAG TPA: phytanoyl-CoA dioxygenase family protein [Oceanospirillales bacterium]|nr:phytanoyl-CoA dioxygenase family protein [Oceanospirillales bacterium]
MNQLVLISAEERSFFQKNGYLVKRNFVDLQRLEQMQAVVEQHLQQRLKPFELEQEVHYPGSPKTRSEEGGDTIRRLLLAFSRDDVFNQWARDSRVSTIMRTLLAAEQLFLVQSHHNCIMTKQPQYSSETHWHKDTRYWNFANNELINTWLPLGDETVENGCLQVIPGSQKWQTPADRLDDRLFLRKDLVANQPWLQKAINVELNRGDLLFFHAAIFHAAGRNYTNKSKNAVVLTYHSQANTPIARSNSVKFDEVLL